MNESSASSGLKVVLIGDQSVGKSTMCMRYVQSFVMGDEKNEEVIKNYNATVKVGENIVNLGIWDTSSKTDFRKMRTLAYAEADAFIIVFSINDSKTFVNATNKWLNEVTKCCPCSTIVFAANKQDLRYSMTEEQGSDQTRDLVSKDQISSQMKLLKYYPFYECSGQTGEGLSDLFVGCVEKTLQDEKLNAKKKKKYAMLENCNRCEIF